MRRPLGSVALLALLTAWWAPALAMNADPYTPPSRDPFRTTIKRRLQPPPPPPIPPGSTGPTRPKPSLAIKVLAIAGEDPDYVAVIRYRGQQIVVEQGFESADKHFRIRSVAVDRLKIVLDDGRLKTLFF